MNQDTTQHSPAPLGKLCHCRDRQWAWLAHDRPWLLLLMALALAPAVVPSKLQGLSSLRSSGGMPIGYLLGWEGSACGPVCTSQLCPWPKCPHHPGPAETRRQAHSCGSFCPPPTTGPCTALTKQSTGIFRSSRAFPAHRCSCLWGPGSWESSWWPWHGELAQRSLSSSPGPVMGSSMNVLTEV